MNQEAPPEEILSDRERLEEVVRMLVTQKEALRELQRSVNWLGFLAFLICILTISGC